MAASQRIMMTLTGHETLDARQPPASTCNGSSRKVSRPPELPQAQRPLKAPGNRASLSKANGQPKPEEPARDKETPAADAEAGWTPLAEVEPPERAPEPRAQHSPYDGETTFRLYLREIGQVKLLTRQEEMELAARIKRGDKKARDQMIKANLRLVVKIARDYEGIGLPLLDLISEGNIGLMKAVERFDPAKGGKLSTYGAWWIKQVDQAGSGQPVQDHPAAGSPGG